MATQEPNLTTDEIQTLKQIAQSVDGDTDIDSLAEATGTSRRDILKIAAALGVGTLAGGATANEMIDAARAAPSTNDSDGNVGLPGDRVDVFAEGIDSNSVETEAQDITAADGTPGELTASNEAIQTALDGYVVPIGKNSGISDAVPITNSTPCQDAFNTADSNAASGSIGIIAPPEVSEAGTLAPPRTASHIIPAAGGANINFTASGSTSDHGLDLSNVGAEFTVLGRLGLTGPGQSATTGFGLTDTSSSPVRTVVADHLQFRDWGNHAIDDPGFQISAGVIEVDKCEPPSGEPIVNNLGRAGSSIQLLAVYSATQRQAIRFDGGPCRIGAINLGNNIGNGVEFGGGGPVSVGIINYEATSQSSAATWAVKMSRAAHHKLGMLRHTGGTLDYHFRLDAGSPSQNPGNKYVPISGGPGTLNNSKVDLQDPPINEQVIYEGVSTAITNNTGTSGFSNGVSCLGNLVNYTA